ncbi:hypothetical protein [Pseudomonas folii]|uniref:Uncharacterized protein n=1 Tax=Pseudomonas folii TaxID=2762593 RepID=A0ABR7B204_9PSED|nr:hypothetical protein [Pseudomonas folii]MBC3951222.1 hypothetical protein [Pseudomonas folii]
MSLMNVLLQLCLSDWNHGAPNIIVQYMPASLFGFEGLLVLIELTKNVNRIKVCGR